MYRMSYAPEGFFPVHPYSLKDLYESLNTGTILQGHAVFCDESHTLHVSFGNGITGVMPRDECVWAPDGVFKDIAVISRVGKPVCCKVIGKCSETTSDIFMLSRKLAQQECIENYLVTLRTGDVVDARVTHLEPFGAFVDVGCGVISLIPIDCMSVSRIAHPRDRFVPGQDLRAVVKNIAEDSGRLTLSHRELLGNWEENAARFAPGQTVTGIVRSIEKYGIFVELLPNLAGLAEPWEGLEPGDGVSVYIKSILPERMKIKLAVIDRAEVPPSTDYDYPDGVTHLDFWRYSPKNCPKSIETIFRTQN